MLRQLAILLLLSITVTVSLSGSFSCHATQQQRNQDQEPDIPIVTQYNNATRNSRSMLQICAEIRNKHGRRFYFTERSMYVETDGFFAHLPYESIVTCDWIDDDPDLMVKARKKQEHGDRLILHDSERKRYELDGLGSAFQGMYMFFHWLKERRRTAG